MQDKTLKRDAKCIYAYLCSFAGNKDEAYPSVSLIISDLCMNNETFFKSLKQLKEKDYIRLKKVKENGQFAKNVYIINKNPCTVSPCTVSPCTVKPNTNNNNNKINNNKSIVFKGEKENKEIEQKEDWIFKQFGNTLSTFRFLDYERYYFTQTFEQINNKGIQHPNVIKAILTEKT